MQNGRNIGEYIICSSTKRRANKLNLLVYPSENTKYKLEVYANNGRFIAHIGLNSQLDYAYLLQMVKIKLISLKYARHLREKWYDDNIDNIYHNRFYRLEHKLLWS